MFPFWKQFKKKAEGKLGAVLKKKKIMNYNFKAREKVLNIF